MKVRKRTEKKGFIIGLWKKEIKWEEDEIERTHKVQWNNRIGTKCYLWLTAYNIDTMILTCENYIYHNIKMGHILSKKLENVVGKVRGKSG